MLVAAPASDSGHHWQDAVQNESQFITAAGTVATRMTTSRRASVRLLFHRAPKLQTRGVLKPQRWKKKLRELKADSNLGLSVYERSA